MHGFCWGFGGGYAWFCKFNWMCRRSWGDHFTAEKLGRNNHSKGNLQAGSGWSMCISAVADAYSISFITYNSIRIIKDSISISYILVLHICNCIYVYMASIGNHGEGSLRFEACLCHIRQLSVFFHTGFLFLRANIYWRVHVAVIFPSRDIYT